jgi:hypothetical protein
MLTGRFFPLTILSLLFFASARCLKSQRHSLKESRWRFVLAFIHLYEFSFFASAQLNRTHSPNELFEENEKRG